LLFSPTHRRFIVKKVLLAGTMPKNWGGGGVDIFCSEKHF